LEIEDRLTEPDADGDSHDTAEIDINELELSDTETDSDDKKSLSTRRRSELFKAIVSVSGLSVDSALDKWVEKGKELNSQEIGLALNSLRRRKMYGRALQVNQSNL